MEAAATIMRGFAVRTGLDFAEMRPTRYLWTDAFAVCNFLGLHAETGDPEALRLALLLIDETHRILGRHRPDDSRSGWISGLEEEEAREHPTVAGLRIGKQLPERGPSEPYDPSLEWDRDGQYFHYLTKWVHALGSVSRVTGDPRYHRWAVELARTAFARFSVFDSTGTPIALRWKMSIDLRRPLVPSMGQHDPLDGFVTFSSLKRGVDGSPSNVALDLRHEIGDLARLCRNRDWNTDDCLGIGGLLTDAYRLAKLIQDGLLDEAELLGDLLLASHEGLRLVVRQRQLERPLSQRLPFREFGLAIGLRAAQRLHESIHGVSGDTIAGGKFGSLVESLAHHAELASMIEDFWNEPEHRGTSNWTDHREINEVMRATALAPHGFLEI